MKEAALTNGTSEPTLDETEVEYQHAFTLRCAAGMQFPPLTIVVTSPIISHAMNACGLTQQTKVADYWSAGVTSDTASHLGSSSATGPVAHVDFPQGVLGHPG